jgi:hypothetical protein
MSRTIVRVAGVAALVAALSACSSGATPSSVSASAVFAGGTAQVEITAPAPSRYTAQLMTGRLYTEGTSTALSVQYGNVQQGSVTYTGPAAPGTYKTERTDTGMTSLALVVGIQGAGGDVPYQTFSSINGECSVTIVKVDRTGGNGTFTCTNLPSADGSMKIDATGTFDAQPAP